PADPAGDLRLARARHAGHGGGQRRRERRVGGARARALALRPHPARAPCEGEEPVRPLRPARARREAAGRRDDPPPPRDLSDRGLLVPDDQLLDAEGDGDEPDGPLPPRGHGEAADGLLRDLVPVPARGVLLALDRAWRLPDGVDEPGGELPARRATLVVGEPLVSPRAPPRQ